MNSSFTMTSCFFHGLNVETDDWISIIVSFLGSIGGVTSTAIAFVVELIKFNPGMDSHPVLLG